MSVDGELLSAGTRARLEGLGGCPLPLDEPWNALRFVQGIAFLEREKIRALDEEPAEKKAWLDETTDSAVYLDGLRKYVELLKSDPTPFENLTSSVFDVKVLSPIFWFLSNRAVEEMYNAATLNHKLAFAGDDLLTPSAEPSSADLPTSQEGEEVKQLAADIVGATLNEGSELKASELEGSGPSTEQSMRLISNALKVNQTQTGETQMSETQIGEKMEGNIEQDESLEMRARLIANEKLQELQNTVNVAIADMQMITANPRTDQSLSKIGF